MFSDSGILFFLFFIAVYLGCVVYATIASALKQLQKNKKNPPFFVWSGYKFFLGEVIPCLFYLFFGFLR